MKGRVLNVEHKPYEWNGKMNDKWMVSVQEGNETKQYACFSKKIAELSGKEVEYTVTPAKDPKYPATMVLPKDEFQKKPWTPAPKADPAEFHKSYAKDVTCALITAGLIKVADVDKSLDHYFEKFESMGKKVDNTVPADKIPF